VAQIIDVRDLAEWMIRMAERRETGVFNATSEPFPFEAMVDGCRAAVQVF